MQLNAQAVDALYILRQHKRVDHCAQCRCRLVADILITQRPLQIGDFAPINLYPSRM